MSIRMRFWSDRISSGGKIPVPEGGKAIGKGFCLSAGKKGSLGDEKKKGYLTNATKNDGGI